MRGGALCLLGLCLLYCTPAALGRQLLQAQSTGSGEPEYFVEVDGLNFRLGCDRFVVAGWNQWEVVEAAAGAPYLSGASIPVNMTGPELVRSLMDEAVQAGLNTMRTWAHPVNPQYALQTAPGVYNEASFKGLDYVIAEAQRKGLKLILAFTSNWTPTGGIPEYLKWAGATQPLQFYTDGRIKDMYKNFVRTLLNRVNTVNGRKYSEDPAIMAWNLINEPRCKGCPAGTIANWIGEMAAFVKQIDSNHLLTVGEDGFYGCCGKPANPGVKHSEWASQEGQDFIADHSSPNIDFATFHGWVDNWNEVSEDFLRNWVQLHVQDSATVLRKPVLFEEFGKWINTTAGATQADRDRFFTTAYNLVSQLEQQPNTALQGAMFWQWYRSGQEAPASEGGGRGLYGIYSSDSVFSSIKANAQVAKQLSKSLPNCSPASHKSASVPAAGDCTQTRVNGEEGTGMEGANCDVDINECVRNTDRCSPNAACINTPGSYNCTCHWGYDGDGRTCSPNQRAIQELQSVYWSQPQGLSCDAGKDVEWPASGPGFIYDPMNSFAFFNTSGGGKFGSRTNVTLLECMEACQAAQACESLVYNDVLEQCFLKSGQCPTANFCWDKEVICSSDNDRGGTFAFGCGFWRSYYRLDMDTAAACKDYTFTPTAGQTGAPDPNNLKPFEEFSKNLAEAMSRFNPAAEKPQQQPSPQPAQPPAPAPAQAPAPAPKGAPGPAATLPAAAAGSGSVPLSSAGNIQFVQPSVQLVDNGAVQASSGPPQGK